MIKYVATVLYYDGIPDSSGDIFSQDTAIQLESSDVPVTFEFKDGSEFRLGTAKLRFNNDRLDCIFYLDDTKLPRYALDPLTPAIEGTVRGRKGKLLTEVAIKSIGLSESGNVDKRIKKLGDKK